MNTVPIGLIGDIGGGELLLVAAAILLLFGGKRLPSIARTLGKTVEDLRKTAQDFKHQLLNADEPPEDLSAPPAGKDTLAVHEPAGESDKASQPTTPPKETPPRDFAG